tara:strand:+ start:349 stop:1665 length:1317 start_codon:yes stop_codon:yes gene_type:complete
MITPNPIQAMILAEDPLRYLIGGDTGVGKTLLALWLSEGRTLVVSDKTARIGGNFERDAKLIGMTPPPHISKEDFKKNVPEACDTLILDECEWAFGVDTNTYSKNKVQHIKTSAIHEAIYTYIQKHQPKRIYFLSATPCEKKMQAWAAARLLGVLKKSDFESFTLFRANTHMDRPRGYSTLWLEKDTEKSKANVRKFLRSFGYFGQAADKVPPKIIDIHVELTEEQKLKMVETGEKYPEKKTEDENGNVPKGAIDENSAVRGGVLYRIECGVFTEYIFDDEKHTQKKIYTKIPNNYLPEILKLVNKEKNPIIFAEYTKQIALIKEYLQENTDLNIVSIQGTMKDEVKKKALHDIANVPGTVLIAQSSMSSSWETLIGTATIYASVTRWRHYHQGMGRNSRHVNRTEEKNVYRLYLGPQSSKIWDGRIDKRKDFNDALR